MKPYYTDAPRPSDRLIPWYIAAAFVLLIVLEAIMVTVAIKTKPGVVAEDSYERGLAYNRYLQEQSEQNARGWTSAVILNGHRLVFVLKDAKGTFLSGAEVKVSVMRPVVAGMDFSATLEETAPGRYESDLAFPQPGQWKVGVTATWQNQPYRTSQVVLVTSPAVR